MQQTGRVIPISTTIASKPQKPGAPTRSNDAYPAGTPVSKELPLNLSLRESLLRGMTAILLPMALLLIDPRILLFISPLIVYLFITALTHICPIKNTWYRRVRKQSGPNANFFWDRD